MATDHDTTDHLPAIHELIERYRPNAINVGPKLTFFAEMWLTDELIKARAEIAGFERARQAWIKAVDAELVEVRRESPAARNEALNAIADIVQANIAEFQRLSVRYGIANAVLDYLFPKPPNREKDSDVDSE